MLFTILIYIAVIGAPALAVYSVFRRTKKADPDVAGYIYNGKNWVAWLLVLSLLAWIFMGFIMPLLDGASYYDPEWGALGFMLIAILLYISYAVIAYVPATAQELEENKDSGKKVIGNVAASATSVFTIILGTIGGVLMALPGMLAEALNPTLAIKEIGGTLYRIVGTGIEHSIGGIVALLVLGIIVFMIIYFAAMIFALIGTFAIGIIAVVKFVKNNKAILQKS